MTEVREVTELITPGPAQALAGLLGVPLPAQGLPLLWHWVYLLDRPPQAALGPDGHPARGGIPVPPGSGLRRMFAGGRVSRRGPLRPGAEATRRTWQAGAAVKQGRSGPLHFVTVRSEISQGGQVVVAEEQDLVYREPAPPAPDRSAEPTAPAAAGGDRDWLVEVDPVLLFRFSALTYNAHRIHYDREYARTEGYPGLVVHGPLQALLMAELARPGVPDRCEYSYRLVAPLFDDQGLIVSAVPEDGAVQVATRDRAGRTTAAGVIRPGLGGPVRASAAAVGAGHQGGQVVRVQEGRRRGRSPGVQAPRAFQVLGGPQLVVDDAVHVAVVLAEAARRVLEVPEEVRAPVVAPEPPDMPFGVVLEHRVGTAAHLVDVVHLPGGVVQERDRGAEHEDVVVVGGTAQERAGALDPVADLEAEPVGEERLGGLVVGRADDGVAELARPDPVLAQHARCAAGPVHPAGAVVRGGGHGVLARPGGDLQEGADARHPLHRADPVRLAVHVDAEPLQSRRGAGQVVGVVHADVQVDQAPGERGHYAELAPAVAGAEPAALFGGEPELGVVGGGLGDVRHAHGDGRQAVQSHSGLPDERMMRIMPTPSSWPAGPPKRKPTWTAAARILAERDPVIARLLAETGPPRLSRPAESHLGTLVRAIVYQQLAGRAAAAIHGRLLTALGGEVEPEGLLALSDEQMRAVGLSRAKVASLRDLAAKVRDGTVVLSPRGLATESDDEIVARLSAVRGIGTWTAEMFLLFQLRRLDVWPVGDLGVRRGYGLAWQVPEPTARELRPLGDPFRPYRSVAAWYCWRAAELYAGAADSALTR
jgi:3-methylfumaryl-CoA hydratase